MTQENLENSKKTAPLSLEEALEILNCKDQNQRNSIFEKLLDEETILWFLLFRQLIARLRGPDGCPWDREQDHLSILKYLIEETYELKDVLESYERAQDPKILAQSISSKESVRASGQFPKKSLDDLKSELGDVFLQVLLHTHMCEERKDLSLKDVFQTSLTKLIRRHPHVFQNPKESSSQEVLKNWESLKKQESKLVEKKTFSSMPRSLPALMRAQRVAEKAARLGFEWNSPESALAKIQEELQEVQELGLHLEKSDASSLKKDLIEEEWGDFLFASVVLIEMQKQNAEEALTKASLKFENRFELMEELLEKDQKSLATLSEKEKLSYWNQAKKQRALS